MPGKWQWKKLSKLAAGRTWITSTDWSVYILHFSDISESFTCTLLWYATMFWSIVYSQSIFEDINQNWHISNPVEFRWWVVWNSTGHIPKECWQAQSLHPGLASWWIPVDCADRGHRGTLGGKTLSSPSDPISSNFYWTCLELSFRFSRLLKSGRTSLVSHCWAGFTETDLFTLIHFVYLRFCTQTVWLKAHFLTMPLLKALSLLCSHYGYLSYLISLSLVDVVPAKAPGFQISWVEAQEIRRPREFKLETKERCLVLFGHSQVVPLWTRSSNLKRRSTGKTCFSDWA